MLEARLHVVMGRAAVSVWCRSHGPEHCLWRGTTWHTVHGAGDLITVMSDGLAHAARLAHRGELEELTDECGG